MRIDLDLSWEQDVMREMCADKVVQFPLFVGGYGSGKSFVLVHNVINDVLSFPGCRVGVYAPTYDLLDLNLVPAICEYLDNIGIRHRYNKTKHSLYLDGGREVIFRTLADPSRIVAYETYSSHVDEADLMPQQKAQEVWDRVIARCRQKHPDYGDDTLNTTAAYTTPESYRFTYQRWKKDPGIGYKFVRAPTWSNINLNKNYIKGLLSSYTPEQQKAYLYGIWTNISSGNVYSYYSRDTCSTTRILRKGETLHIGQDFNVGGCCGVGYVIDRVDGNDIVYQVVEYAEENTQEVVNRLKKDYNGNRIIIYPDSTGRNESSNASASDIRILRAGGFEVRANKTNPRIENRVNAVQRMLYNGWLFINPDTCPESADARERHAYSRLTGKPEKFPGPGTIDDRNDAADYPISFRYPIKGVKPKTKHSGW